MRAFVVAEDMGGAGGHSAMAIAVPKMPSEREAIVKIGARRCEVAKKILILQSRRQNVLRHGPVVQWIE